LGYTVKGGKKKGKRRKRKKQRKRLSRWCRSLSLSLSLCRQRPTCWEYALEVIIEMMILRLYP
jgi:putative component of membrane protein insertase Oxa1/YidC/SpoIIIJ protein YidD